MVHEILKECIPEFINLFNQFLLGICYIKLIPLSISGIYHVSQFKKMKRPCLQGDYKDSKIIHTNIYYAKSGTRSVLMIEGTKDCDCWGSD